MINKIICFLFGHKWGEESARYGVYYSNGKKSYSLKFCRRCSKHQYTFIKETDFSSGINCNSEIEWTSSYNGD